MADRYQISASDTGQTRSAQKLCFRCVTRVVKHTREASTAKKCQVVFVAIYLSGQLIWISIPWKTSGGGGEGSAVATLLHLQNWALDVQISFFAIGQRKRILFPVSAQKDVRGLRRNETRGSGVRYVDPAGPIRLKYIELRLKNEYLCYVRRDMMHSALRDIA